MPTSPPAKGHVALPTVEDTAGQKRLMLCAVLKGAPAAWWHSTVSALETHFNLAESHRLRMPPHFTLKYWVWCDASQEEALHTALTAFAQQQKAVPLYLKGLSSFGDDVVFAQPVLNEVFEQAFADLVKMLKTLDWMTWRDYDAPHNHFHVTLAWKAEPNTMRRIRTWLEAENSIPNMPLLWDNITVMRSFKQENALDRVDVYKEYPLGAL